MNNSEYLVFIFQPYTSGDISSTLHEILINIFLLDTFFKLFSILKLDISSMESVTLLH